MDGVDEVREQPDVEIAGYRIDRLLGRPQAPLPGACGGRSLPRAVPARIEARGEPRPPQRDPDLRGGRGRGEEERESGTLARPAQADERSIDERLERPENPVLDWHGATAPGRSPRAKGTPSQSLLAERAAAAACWSWSMTGGSLATRRGTARRARPASARRGARLRTALRARTRSALAAPVRPHPRASGRTTGRRL